MQPRSWVGVPSCWWTGGMIAQHNYKRISETISAHFAYDTTHAW